MIIALASPAVAVTLEDGLEKVRRHLAEAAAQGAAIVCFPEAYLPGLRGQDLEVLKFGEAEQHDVVRAVSAWSAQYRVATILGMEWITPAGRQIVALVTDAAGQVLGCQSKNQLAPSEEAFYVPGDRRQLFQIAGLTFGVAICHEAWRYPETVRWAAVRGAQIVFQPQHTGSDLQGVVLTSWGAASNPYYEKAMICRAMENTIYFASVNNGLRFQDSATSLITPDGACQAHLPYGAEGLLVQEIDLSQASGLLARRFAPERHGAGSRR